MSASSLITLPGPAFRSLLHAVHRAVKPIHRAHPSRCPPRRCECPPCDAGQFRLLLNDARHEIDLLRLQMLGTPRCIIRLQPTRGMDNHPSIEGLRLAELASPTHHRRSYAVRAVGDVRGLQHAAHAMWNRMSPARLGALIDALL